MKHNRFRLWFVTLALLVCWLGTCACAEEQVFDGRFDIQALSSYAADERSAAYDYVVFETENFSDVAYWKYTTYDPAMHYTFDQQAVHGAADVSVVLLGYRHEYGLPFLDMNVNMDQKISPRLLQLRVGEHLYWIDLKRAQEYMTIDVDDEGGYDMSMDIALGTAGQTLLNDLYAARFAFALRLYDANRLCFAFEQEAQAEDGSYARFYEGLLASDFLDADGRVQPSCWQALLRLDAATAVPKTAIYPLDDKLWLADGEEAVPKTQKSIQAIAHEERDEVTSLTFTGYGDWGRSKGVPWIKMQLKNADKKKTVTHVTFVYYCTDKDDAMLYHEETGEAYGTITLEQKIKPKKKANFAKYSFTGYDEEARYLYTAVREVTYSDNTTATISDRDLVFSTWTIK